MAKRNQQQNIRRFTQRMQRKLAVLFILILVAFAILSARLFSINRDNGDKYKKQVLSQQAYDSVTLPAKRGEIVDRNNTKIAVSQKVYNVIIDAKTLNGDEGAYIESTLNALYSSPVSFNYTRDELRNYILGNPSSQYRVIAKKQKYDAVSAIMDMVNNPSLYPDFKGVWLEDTYQRQYPYNSLACDVIGFVQGDNEGAYGLEEYYNDILVGTNGREYGYLNDDETLERTLKPAQDGKTLVTSLDVNIQSIVEKHILAFNEEHKNEYREGNGSSNTGVIIMNPSNGEVLAMASYPVFDLNNPRDVSKVDFEVALDPEDFGLMTGILDSGTNIDDMTNEELQETLKRLLNQDNGGIIEITTGSDTGNVSQDNGNEASMQGILNEQNVNENNDADSSGESDVNDSATHNIDIATAGSDELQNSTNGPDGAKGDIRTGKYAGMTYNEAYDAAYEAAKMEALNALWKNFCINSTYEPGSTMKPFTMATGLEDGTFTGEESYVCNGVLTVGDHEIHCNNRLGHGPLTFSGALEQSCNVAFMKMGAALGKSEFMKYNQIFNFGLKTNIDLTGEAMTNNLVFDINTMTPTDLAISSFGQGFNVTMIQMAAGFCSLINGGYYYMPHLVTKILDSSGTTVDTIEPREIKQTISEETSAKIRDLCIAVVEEGTGKSARPAGYRIGGKTGTAEKYPRGTGNYVVSFMSFAPADNPQLVCYVVIDEPNVQSQASAKYAAVLCKDILTEVLPYMNIFQTEELTEKEAAELAEKQQEFSTGSTGEQVQEEAEGVIIVDQNNGNQNLNGGSEESGIEIIRDNAITFVDEEEAKKPDIQFDPSTGYAIDPTTGDLLDPETGMPVDPNVSNLD